MNIQQLCKDAHQNSVDHGFYDKVNQNVAEKLMLIVSELSEALEAHRCGRFADFKRYDAFKKVDSSACNRIFGQDIKDTFEDEIADVFIRLCDLCEWMEIDIKKHIQLKMAYNKKRPYKHGKEY